MALQKQIYINNNSGISAEYWKIQKVISEWISSENQIINTITILLEGYLTEQARLDGRDPFMSKTIVTNESEANVYFNPSILQNSNLITQAYQFIKDNVYEFSDAIDI